MSYIAFSDNTEPYTLPTNRTTMAVYIYSYVYPSASNYLRARFYQKDGDSETPIEAVWCEDFYADKILDEQNDPASDMFYSSAFGDHPETWICPNTTSIEVNNYDTYMYMSVYSCSESKELDKTEGSMTPYTGKYHLCGD